MKKLFALALVVFGLAACQTEPEGLDVQMGGEQEVMLTVSLPEATRANSASDALTNGVLSTHNLRYIVEVYRVNEGTVLYDTCQRFVETSDKTRMVFPVRLAPNYDYRIVAWTDIVEKNAADPKADRCYKTTDGLDAVEIIESMWNPMDETRDAYTCWTDVDDFSSASNLDMILTRPFAKVRVVATDINDIREVGLEPTTATVGYLQNMYRSFNAVTGEASTAAEKSHTINYPATPVYKDATGEMTLFADYIFVNGLSTAKFSLDVYAEAGLIKENDFNTEICVERNKLTTIKGDVLTVGGNVEVKVENELGQLETINYADNAETLQEIINEAPVGEQTNITIGGDIDLDDLLNAGISSTTRAEKEYGLEVPAGKEVVLDLNGYTISQTKECAYVYSMIVNKGTLTITDSSENGTGKISFKDTGAGDSAFGWGSYTLTNEGTLVIENGTIENTTSLNTNNNVIHMYCAIQQANGSTTIKGGNISNNTYRSIRANRGTLTIEGGNFNGQIWMQPFAENSSIAISGGKFQPSGADGSSIFVTNNEKHVALTVTGGEFMTKIGCSDATKLEGVITGGTFTTAAKEGTAVNLLANGYEFVEGENGNWTVAKKSAAKIGDTIYYDLSEALAAAKAGDTVIMMNDVTLSEECSLPAGIIFNGNGKQINGSIYAGGDITFAGHTKVTAFSASYYDRTITIGEGACLEVTGTGRVSLAYGNTFNITGSIDNAKTADKANIQPSLIIPGGISITGGNNAAMNVTNAYVKIGSTTSKPGAADGKFTLNFTNSIAEFTKEFGFYEPTGGKTPKFEMNITNSVFTTATKLCVAATNSEIVIDNSVVTLGTYFRNSGKFDLVNGSVMTGSTIQFGENGGNNGTINVDASTFTITASSTGHAFDGQNIGKINATNGATVSVDYYKAMTINVDATSTFTGVDVDANKKIYYVSDEMALEPTNPDALNAKVVSNVWDKTTGKGVITFDANLTTIGEKAFQRVTNTTPSNWITSITLPESVTTIGDYAFAQCSSLTTINIPDSVISIGQYAFQSCGAVTTVTIGSGVKSIGSSAFYNCYEIKEIICESTTAPALADKWVFYGVDEVAKVYVPAAYVDAYKAAWSMFADKIVAGEF